MKAPLRSTATEAITTIVAVITILSASSYQKNRSGGTTRPQVGLSWMNYRGCSVGSLSPLRGARERHRDRGATGKSRAIHPHLDRRAALERLVDHAVALGELEQLVELVLRRVGLDVEAQADLRETDRRVLGDAERAAEVEIAFGRHLGGLERDVDRSGDRLQGDAGA